MSEVTLYRTSTGHVSNSLDETPKIFEDYREEVSNSLDETYEARSEDMRLKKVLVSSLLKNFGSNANPPGKPRIVWTRHAQMAAGT